MLERSIGIKTSEQSSDHKTQTEKGLMISRPNLAIEDTILLVGLFCFTIFLGVIGFLLLPLLIRSSVTSIASLPVPVNPTPTSEFMLGPTWTPSPTPEAMPTLVGTSVFTGRLAVHLYRPRDPQSPFRIPTPASFWFPVSAKTEVLDLARIMQGESTGDIEAAYRVGWVAKNRRLHGGYGNSYYEVSSGFFGYRRDIRPSDAFLQKAEQVIRSRRDPTGGCLYALSRTDITNLGVPPQRADVAYGEWFFFKTWPLSVRYNR